MWGSATGDHGLGSKGRTQGSREPPLPQQMKSPWIPVSPVEVPGHEQAASGPVLSGWWPWLQGTMYEGSQRAPPGQASTCHHGLPLVVPSGGWLGQGRSVQPLPLPSPCLHHTVNLGGAGRGGSGHDGSHGTDEAEAVNVQGACGVRGDSSNPRGLNAASSAHLCPYLFAFPHIHTRPNPQPIFSSNPGLAQSQPLVTWPLPYPAPWPRASLLNSTQRPLSSCAKLAASQALPCPHSFP